MCKIEFQIWYPTVNESRLVILLRQVWVYVRKREGFRRGRRRTNLRGRSESEFERKRKCKNIL